MENEEHYDFNSTSTPSMNPTPHPAWEEEFDEIIFGGLQNDWRVQVTYSEKEREIRNLIRSLLKEERTATLREVIAEVQRVKDRGYNHGYSVRNHLEKFLQHKLTSEL